MSLSKIPVEVVEGHVFKYLAWNDLLRLRRVSKGFRALVNGYFNTEIGTERAPEMSVSPSSIGLFTEMNIPPTRIYFRNRYGDRNEVRTPDEKITAFAEKCGGKVKHLRLEQFSEYLPHADTLQLLEGLPNLESLTVDTLLGRPTPQHPRVPRLAVLQTLKALQLYVECRGLYTAEEIRDTGFHESLPSWLTECRSLEKLRLCMEPSFVQDVSLIVRRVLEALIVAVDTGKGWKEIELDIDLLLPDGVTVDAFQRLLATCAAKNVAVAGVYASWLRDRRPPQERGSLISYPMTGLLRVGVGAPDLRHLKLDKLTTLEFSSTNVSMGGPGLERLCWAATLKTLLLPLHWWDEEVGELFQTVSGGQPLVALQEVSIRFPRAADATLASQHLEQLVNMAPNVKELTLENWHGLPEAFARLLPRLHHLEKLSLMDCWRLGDEAFVGSDLSKPAFLQLRSLRRLSLKNSIDGALDLTANCFASVFRHISLTHFEMSAVKSQSEEFQERCAWLKLLLEGRFAESIEEIKWDGRRLHEVQDRELQEIGMSFRSFNML